MKFKNTILKYNDHINVMFKLNTLKPPNFNDYFEYRFNNMKILRTNLLNKRTYLNKIYSSASMR